MAMKKLKIPIEYWDLNTTELKGLHLTRIVLKKGLMSTNLLTNRYKD